MKITIMSILFIFPVQLVLSMDSSGQHALLMHALRDNKINDALVLLENSSIDVN